MLDFDKYLLRHGEHGIQALLEKIEHYEGIRHLDPVPLEDRWHALMNVPQSNLMAA